MSFEDMTPYEQAAWRQCVKSLYGQPGRSLVPGFVRSGVSGVSSMITSTVGVVPGADLARDVIERSFEGTLALTFQPALRSASPESTVKYAAKTHSHVTTYQDVRRLSLEHRDALQPSRFGYAAASAGQGAATALAVTGAEVATTVTAGTSAVVAVGAVAADAVASMAMMGRTIGAVACGYGYDVSQPDEELFAMGVLSLGAAGSMAAKTQSLAALSRLTQQMMRQATWKQLNEHLLVRVLDQMYTALGFKLVKRKLAQAVPLVGIALNATMSAQLTDQTFRRAQAVYRLRTLSETYGINPDEWMASASPAGAKAAESEDEPLIDVVEVLEAERTQDQNGEQRPL